MTQILKPSSKNLKLAAETIKKGDVVAFPTETVYGLGASAENEDAVLKIYEAKGRPQDNPLIVHVHSKKQIVRYVQNINKLQQKLINTFMPGAISIVFEKNDRIADIVCAGGETVAIRIPCNKIARKFIKYTNLPICAPSANSSKRPSPTNAQHVLDDLNGKIPYIIDGGNCDVGIESTVVKVKDNVVYILRPGKVSKMEIQKKIKCEVIDVITQKSDVVESPGTKYAHYMPKCEMILFNKNKVNNINKYYEEIIKNDKRAVIFCNTCNKKYYTGKNVVCLGNNSNSASKNLFNYLRKYEDNDIILAEVINNGTMQTALYNRMLKSASGNEK